jgi:O-antigen/teichoic acid export membrane protein
MDTPRRMNAFVKVIVCDIVSKAMLGSSVLLLIRLLSPHEYASYAYTLALVTVISQTVSGSLNRIYIVSTNTPSSNASSDLFPLAHVWGCLALFPLALPFLPSDPSIWCLTLLLSVVMCLYEYARTFYQSQRHFRSFAFIDLLKSSNLLGALLILPLLGARPICACLVLSCQLLVMAVSLWAVLRHLLAPLCISNLWPALRLFLFTVTGKYKYVTGYIVLVATLSNLPLFLLRLLSDDERVATFAVAFRVYNLLSLVLVGIHAVLLPTIQNCARPTDLEPILSSHRSAAPMFGCLLVLFASTSHWFWPLIDNGNYPDGPLVFRILCLCLFASFILSPYINVLVVAKDFRFVFWTMLAGVLSTGLLSTLLILSWGIVGAALAFVIGATTINAVIYFRSKTFRREWRSPSLFPI